MVLGSPNNIPIFSEEIWENYIKEKAAQWAGAIEYTDCICAEE